MKITIPLLACYLLIPATLAGCGMLPSPSTLLEPSAVASMPETAPIKLTLAASETPVQPGEQTAEPVILLTDQPEVDATASRPCDVIAPGQPIDVTVRDGSSYHTGESFAKTWRLVNAGSCSWTSDYSVVWFSGQMLGPVIEQRMGAVTAPGESLEITVDMVAPETPGTYQSNWKMRNADGDLFGLGPGGDAPFWVKVEVLQLSTDTPSPQATPNPTLAVYYSDTANLAANDRIDLDSGVVNHEGEDDLSYLVTNAGSQTLLPQNGARAAFFGSQPPVETDCQNAFLGSESVVLSEPVNGTYLCYRTNQGLPGFIRLTQPEETTDSLSLDFVTWIVP